MNGATWVLATGNRGKALEVASALRPAGIKILSLKDIGFNKKIEENGSDFKENARIKAEAVAAHCEFPVLSDDSGLAVDKLKGMPGVFSARYAGPQAGDRSNRQKLLKALGKNSERNACFICVLCLIQTMDNPEFFEGRCEGTIAFKEVGRNGFGYDSLFIPRGYRETFGQLSPEIKMRLSHRGRALEKLLAKIG
jgi:XTP/dITP diphosphohydrolase